MPLRRLRQVRPMTWWAIAFTLLVFYGLNDSRRLGDENRQRIADIQETRISSCRQTYEGVREVFRPLFPTRPNPQQRKTLRTFNKTIDDRKANCGRQTQGQEEP